METFYAMIDGNVTELRLPKAEVKNNYWEGYPAATSVTELMQVCGEIILNNNKKGA